MPNNSNSAVFCGKKRAISKVLALLLTATALYMLWGIWIPIIKTHEFNSLFDLIFLFIFPVPSTFLAIYFLHTATILRRGISARGIHKFSVCLSLLFAALVLVIFLGIKKFISPSKNFFWMEFPTAFVMIAAGIFFLPVKRGLLRCFSVTDVFDSGRFQV